VARWLYATLEGVGSARARLCEEHDAYRWMCGGVSVNYHTLADFRVEHLGYLNGVLTSSVAALLAEGLVTLTRVAQDGLRVRASAGAASFRRQERRQEYWAEATAQVEALRRASCTRMRARPRGARRRPGRAPPRSVGSGWPARWRR